MQMTMNLMYNNIISAYEREYEQSIRALHQSSVCIVISAICVSISTSESSS